MQHMSIILSPLFCDTRKNFFKKKKFISPSVDDTEGNVSPAFFPSALLCDIHDFLFYVDHVITLFYKTVHFFLFVLA